MQVTVENLGGLGRRMRVEVPALTLKQRVDQQLRDYASKANIKGFRRGKVPAKVIEQRFGSKIRADVRQDLVRETLNEALTKEGLRPAASPAVNAEPVEDSFAYTATFDVLPEIGAIEVADLKIERETAQVSEADIDRMIENLRKQRVGYRPAERAAQESDMAAFEYQIEGEGLRVPAEGTERGAAILGQGAIFPEMEAALVGLSVGEEFETEISFAADYRDATLAGKTARVHGKLLKLSAPEMPEADAEFIRSFGVTDGELESFRREIRANLERELAQALSARLRMAVVEQLVAKYDHLEVPASLVDLECRSLQERDQAELRRRAQSAGMSNVPSAPDLSHYADAARKRVRAGLLLNEIAGQQGLRLQPQRVEAAIAQVASTYEDPAEVVQWYQQSPELLRSVQNRVMEEQVAEWVASKAQVTEVERSFTEIVSPQTAGGAA